MSKKLKVVITIIALCLGLMFVGTKAYATTGKAINDTTRIRKKANTTSEVVGVLDKNKKIEVLSEEDGWYKVKYKGTDETITGYIRNDLLEVDGEKKTETKKEEVEVEETTTEANKTEAKAEETEKEETTASEENEEVQEQENQIVENEEIQLKSDIELQLLPVIFSCKTGTITANTKVTISEVVGNWTRIESENQEGWILTSKVQGNETEIKQEESKKEEKQEEPKKE